MITVSRPMPPIAVPPSSGMKRLQTGVALVVGLIFLLITTLMAVTAMSGVIMQERMAGNLRNISVAQAGVESALRAGESWIREFHSRGDQLAGDCSATDLVFASTSSAMDLLESGCQANMTALNEFRNSKQWIESPSSAFIQDFPVARISDGDLESHTGASLARRPQFSVESLGPLRGLDSVGGQVGSFGGVDAAGSGSTTPPATVYRITARSTGSTLNVVRAADTYYVGIMGGAEAPPPPVIP